MDQSQSPLVEKKQRIGFSDLSCVVLCLNVVGKGSTDDHVGGDLLHSSVFNTWSCPGLSLIVAFMPFSWFYLGQLENLSIIVIHSSIKLRQQYDASL